VDSIEKPDELLALHGVTAELFGILRSWFDVPDELTLSLSDVDAAVTELGDPVMIAGMAMRKLQALRLLAQPGVRTSTDVVVTMVQDLDRALLQAPTMRLRRAAEAADWDAALEQLVGDDTPSQAPAEVTEEDAEALHFRGLHGQLHTAVRAVVEASDGEIRYLI
jgi:hypothetical protein